MKKIISAEILLNLTIEYDPVTESLNLVSCIPNITSTNTYQKQDKHLHVLTSTQCKFGILTLGTKNLVGRMLPLGTEIFIEVNGVRYTNKHIFTHKTVRGRVDGLTNFYSDYSDFIEGKQISLEYEPNDKVLKIFT